MCWVVAAIVMAAIVPSFGREDTNEIKGLSVEQARQLAEGAGDARWWANPRRPKAAFGQGGRGVAGQFQKPSR